ncbi:hypothetical protein EG827_12425, partial [bacterium]|nr:hypothetical protein [bacterium]
MRTFILSPIARGMNRITCILFVIIMAWSPWAHAAGLLPGPGETIDTGIITIPYGLAVELEGILTGDVRVINYGTVTASLGQVKGQARIENLGSILNLSLYENAFVVNTNSGSVNNLIMRGVSLVENSGSIGNLNMIGACSAVNSGYLGNLNMNDSNFVNSGTVNNFTMSGSSQAQNDSFINNIHMLDTISMQNNGTLNNAKLDAFNGDNVSFQNFGTANNVDADVYSTNNNGYITMQNNGLFKNLDIYDNVPWQPGDPVDLITVNNHGSIQNMKSGTGGIGLWDLNNWGNIGYLNGTGRGSLWFSGNNEIDTLSLFSKSQSLNADSLNPMIIDHDMTIGLISLDIDGPVYVGQSPVPVPGT